MLANIAPKSEALFTPRELEAAFRNAEIGDHFVYFVGDLRFARESKDYIGTELGAGAEAIGRYTRGLYEAGEADLTQKRLGPNRFEYRVAKR